MHVEVEAEAGLGNQGERPGDLRSGVRSLNLLDTPSLPSGLGAWMSVRSPCSATGPFSSTDIRPEDPLQASWGLASEG